MAKASKSAPASSSKKPAAPAKKSMTKTSADKAVKNQGNLKKAAGVKQSTI